MCIRDRDDTYKRLKYTRYADDFLIGVIGSKADCIKIKSDITQYMQECLHLEMSQEKTLITNAQKPAKFLGYEVLVRKTDVTKRNKFNVPVRSFNGTVVLKVATETVKNRLEHYEAIKYKMENGVQTWFSKLRGKLMKKKIEDIVARYNSEIRGFYNYYSIANNVSYAASKFGYIMEYSMYHTIAAKTNSSISKVIDKYKKGNDIIVPVSYTHLIALPVSTPMVRADNKFACSLDVFLSITQTKIDSSLSIYIVLFGSLPYKCSHFHNLQFNFWIEHCKVSELFPNCSQLS